MKAEDLMKPRYKLVADYPNNKSEVGRIFGHNVNGTENVMPLQEWLDFHNTYPAIFKPLQWWEERKAEDMPEYVKDRHGVYQVERWEPNAAQLVIYLKEPYDGFKDWYPQNLYGIEPSTESEYLQSKEAIKQIK